MRRERFFLLTRIPLLLLALIGVQAGAGGMADAACLPPDPSPADAITALVADESDTDPAGTRIPLILVHGIHGNQNPQDGSDTIAYKNRSYWNSFLGYFGADAAFRLKYKVFRFHYVSDVYPVQEIARAFRNHLDAAVGSGTIPDTPFVLIAHSMGGLVARSYMQEHTHISGVYCGQRGGDRIAKLITLATPHHGTPAANDAPRIDPLVYPGWAFALTVVDRAYWCKEFPCVSDEFVDVTEPNRSDLRWDDYNGLAGYNDCPRECNAWLQALNADPSYEGKLAVYAGFINSSNSSLYNSLDDLGPFELLAWLSAQTRTDAEKLAAVAVILKKIYPSFDNDGLVPFDSAAFQGHPLRMRIECPGYDHLDMKDSKSQVCANGRTLFQSLHDDLGIEPSRAATAGVFRSSDGVFYLDYNGTGTWDGCGADRCLSIGMNGDVPLVGDWNGSTASKVGLFRPSDGTFYLDYNGNGQWDGCGTDRCLQIGMNGDVPLVGDWNGSGTSKVGAFRPSDGTFYLDYNGNGTWDGCGIDRCLQIGMNGDVPLVGDWNGSGISKVGAFRPSNGTFYLDYNGSGTWEGCGVDRCLQIGMNGDVPLVGDWDGSGTRKVGAFRPSDGTFYLDYNGNGVWDGCETDRCLAIGMNGDIPLVGDWDGTGSTKVGAFRPSDGTFYLDYNGSGTWDGCGTDRCLQIGLSGDTPLVGKW
jgi:pimeloyl-ACP methyl ester carboxylesterase